MRRAGPVQRGVPQEPLRSRAGRRAGPQLSLRRLQGLLRPRPAVRGRRRRNLAPRRWTLALEFLFKELDRALPGQLGRALVVVGPGVVHEGVLGALIRIDLEVDARLLQRVFESRDAGVDALVVRGVV